MSVLVTGATGLVGGRLVAALRADGAEIRALSRNPERAQQVLGDAVQVFGWTDGLSDALRGAAAVVHLAGAGLFGRRWSSAYKAELRSSRIARTGELVDAVAALPASERPAVLVSSSAVGVYGPRDDTVLDEAAAPGDDFLAALCADWEAAALRASAHGVRVVVLRSGIVLARDGGALKTMTLPFKWFLGGPVLPGTQWMSWIHIDDLVALTRFAMREESLHGPVNATAPNPVTNREFSKAFARALHRPCWAPVPGFVLRLRFGEVAGILTTGQRVVPQAATDAGFTFQHPEIGPAMQAIHAA